MRILLLKFIALSISKDVDKIALLLVRVRVKTIKFPFYDSIVVAQIDNFTFNVFIMTIRNYFIRIFCGNSCVCQTAVKCNTVLNVDYDDRALRAKRESILKREKSRRDHVLPVERISCAYKWRRK